ncbi:hypothetical protein KQH65_12155 [archaeon]|nr:hypothetical protein [archaeon]
MSAINDPCLRRLVSTDLDLFSIRSASIYSILSFDSKLAFISEGLQQGFQGDKRNSQTVRGRTGRPLVTIPLYCEIEETDRVIAYRIMRCREACRSGAIVKPHPTILEYAGKKERVILSYKEFECIKTELRDYEDLHDLRVAKLSEGEAKTAVFVIYQRNWKFNIQMTIPFRLCHV